MDYYQAEKIRNTSFRERWQAKQRIHNQGMGEAFSNTFSEGIGARVKMVKKLADPMNWLKSIPGLGKNFALEYAKRTGRSQSDKDYFSGIKKKDTASKIISNTSSDSLGGDATEVLTSMLTFMKSSREEDKRAREIRHNFDEEKATEEQRRHDELLEALGATKTAKPIKQATTSTGGTESLFGSIMSAAKGLLATLVTSIESMVKGLISAAFASIAWLKNLKFLAKLSPNILSTLYKILTSPILRLLGGPLAMVGSILGLSWLLGEAVKMVPNMKALSPTEAANILQSGSWSDIENAGGEEKLRTIIKNGPEEAQRLLESGTDEQILEAGGIAKLKQIVREGRIEMPTNEIPQMPESVPTRSKKNPGMASVWDQKYSKFFDPDTGKRLSKDNFDDVEMKKLKRQNGPEPVIDNIQSPTSLLSDLMEKRKELELEDLTDGASNIMGNIFNTDNNVSGERASPYSSSATQRDETSILKFILDGHKAYSLY